MDLERAAISLGEAPSPNRTNAAVRDTDPPAPVDRGDSVEAVAAGLLEEEEELQGRQPDRDDPATEPAEQEYDESSEGDEDPYEDLLEMLSSDAEEADPDEVDGEGDETRFTVKVHGEEIEVSEEELKAGYSRQADYSRRMNELQEVREQAESELNQVRQERQQYAVLLNQLRTQLTREPEPDWDRLKEEDPLGYTMAREEWRERKERIEAAEAEQVRLQHQQMQEMQRQRSQRLQEESEKLLERIPEWKDAERAQRERDELVEFATGDHLRFTPDEVAQVEDHRILLLLRDAMRYRRLVERAGDVKKRARTRGPEPVRPGSRRGGTPRTKQRREQDAARERMMQTGSVEDVAAFLSSKPL